MAQACFVPFCACRSCVNVLHPLWLQGVQAVRMIRDWCHRRSDPDEFWRRAKQLGLVVRVRKPDGSGWRHRPKADIINDYKRTLDEGQRPFQAAIGIRFLRMLLSLAALCGTSAVVDAGRRRLGRFAFIIAIRSGSRLSRLSRWSGAGGSIPGDHGLR